ncbi:hypothetical protein FHL15_008862 [Xylaria flabelliformis]|uniref:NACHT domain-containing protein n=1 Tax=Xylaria flabelliformis TaxID=2512241 RepID=A0A553HQT9_9PEZI|nr:hypothetical protein FHL15_008862 [Xylaria flabelliformis]
MEAFATLSFVGNVIQVVEVSTKLIKTTIKLANSAAEVPDEINDAIVIRDSLVSLLQVIKAPRPTRSEHDRQLLRLAEGCQKVCDELLNHIGHIKGKGDSSKTGVLGVTWRTLTSGGKLNSIEQSHKHSATYTLIESLIKQQDAHTQSLQELINKTKDNIIEAIKSDLNNVQSNAGRVRGEFIQDNRPTVPSPLQTIPEHLNYGGSHDFNAPPEAQSDILVAVRTALATIVQTSKAITVQDWLYFPELLSRERAIDHAHEKTFTWLLHDGDPNENFEEHETYHYDFRRGDSETSRNRIAMCRWLKSGSGIFYISGKAGSGKSTLMKYLAGAPQTREHLDDWAHKDGKDLIFAEFFFWRSGAPLQRDIEGLYRGILWKILAAHPDFTQDVSSAFWGDKDGTFDGRIRPPKPTLLELEAAFDILTESPKALRKHRVCLFIDGLDEFEGDYWKLSQRLVNWCASDDVKICVSSRPRNEFSKAFAAIRGITCFSLHDLTKLDMLHFVRDTFEKDLRYVEACTENPECPSLFSSIVDRADGVFLWVRLVLNELLVDMGNSSSMAQLRQKLDEIPCDLISLYDQMLRRVNRLDRVKLARTFTLIDPEFRPLIRGRRMSSYYPEYSEWANLSVYAHAVLDDIADDPDLETQLLDGSLGPYLSRSGCISKCSQMRRRLIGRCQGLLDIVETGRPFPNCHMISFFHRSVVDFLKEPEIASYMQELLRDFNPRRALAHILLAKVKFVPIRLSNAPKHFDHQVTSPDEDDEAACDMSAEKEVSSLMVDLGILSTERYSLFEEVNSLKRMAEKMNFDENKWVRTLWRGFNNFAPEKIDIADLDSTVLCTVLSVNCSVELAREIIRRSPRVLDNPKWNPLLSIWLASTPFMNENKTSLIRLLLENDASPNTELSSKVCSEGPSGWLERTTPSPMTPWMLALWNLSLNWPFCKAYKSKFLSCIELLLVHGADPFVYFVGYKVHPSASEDNSGLESEGKTRGEYYYVDLMTMMNIWELQPTEQIRRLLRSSHLSQGPAKLGGYFRCLRQREKVREKHIHPILRNLPNNTEFRVLCVIPRQALTRISIADLEDMHEMYGWHDEAEAYVTRVWNLIRE